MHTKCGVIHTDLKPENVLLLRTLPPVHKRKRNEKKEKRYIFHTPEIPLTTIQ